MQLEHEIRIERATAGAKRRPIRRAVKLPGATQHADNDEGAETIARRIRLAKMERRVRQNG